MKEFFPVLHTAALFSGISDDELAPCSPASGQGSTPFQRLPPASRRRGGGGGGTCVGGQRPHYAGGYLGKPQHPLQDRAGADLADVFACAPGAVLNVSVEAESTMTVMFLHIRRVLSVCPSACSHHSRIIRNLLDELAEKNLRLNEKLTHMAQRTTRAKLMSYFSAEAQRRSVYESTFRFQGSSLRITSVWSAAGCPWSLEKCGMRACSTFTKAISFLKTPVG